MTLFKSLLWYKVSGKVNDYANTMNIVINIVIVCKGMYGKQLVLCYNSSIILLFRCYLCLSVSRILTSPSNPILELLPNYISKKYKSNPINLSSIVIISYYTM